MNNTNIKLIIIKFNGKSKCLKYRYPDNIDFNLKVYVVIWVFKKHLYMVFHESCDKHWKHFHDFDIITWFEADFNGRGRKHLKSWNGKKYLSI